MCNELTPQSPQAAADAVEVVRQDDGICGGCGQWRAGNHREPWYCTTSFYVVDTTAFITEIRTPINR
jgi:hypothetical protein